MDVSAALAPLEDGYDAVLDTLVAVAWDDERIRAVWLSGSVGRGTADAGSDLDVILTVPDVGDFLDPDRWAVLDPIITIPVPGLPGGFAFTTRAGLRVDVVVEAVAAHATTPYRHRVAVLDKDGLGTPTPDDDPPGPDLARMDAVVTEFLRQGAIFPAAIVARRDWLLGQVATHNCNVQLYNLLAQANEPLPPMGVKQWSSRLTPEQRELLASLPRPTATRESVVEAMTEAKDALRTHGRAALEAVGGTWPVDVERAIAAYWHRHGLDWTDPL
jgi:hypothetical protein